MKKTPQHFKGFTLIETMVAISILMFAILGPLSIASSGLVNARIARDQVSAFYLAQEGLEFVRYTRDTNYLDNPSSVDPDQWIAGLSDCFTTNGCRIDVASYYASGSSDPSDAIDPCGSECGPLSINEVTGLYTYDPGDRYSSFTRVVKTETIGTDNNEIQVTATVTWQTGYVTKTVSLSENIRNIYSYE